VAVRSVVEIDLNDARFQAFKKLHDAYTTALKAAPAQWALVNRQIAAGEKGLSRQVSLTRQWGNEVGRVRRELTGIASTVGHITTSVLRWGGVGGVLGGLLGLGGLFGIEGLAQGAAGVRRRALGLGTGFGGVQSFGGAFGRFVGPDFLERVAGGRFDLSQRLGLLGAGLTGGQIDSGDTAATGTALLRNLKRIADTTNPALFGQVIQGRQLPTTPEELERLSKIKPDEFSRQLALQAQRQKELKVDDDVLKKYDDLLSTLDFAEKKINQVFVKGLVKLAPPLEHLSTAVTDVVVTFLKAAEKRHWIDGLAIALERFAKYIGTPQFDQDVKGFVDNIGKLTTAVGGAASWFASWFGGGPAARPRGSLIRDFRQHQREQQTSAAFNSAVMAPFRFAKGVLEWTPGSIFGSGSMTPDQLLGIVRQSENSGDTAVSPPGAIGRYQIMPKTGAAFGATPEQLRDPAISEMVARRFLAQLVRKYHGDTDKILSAYNMGETQFDRVLAGKRSLPLETQKYVTGAHQMTGYAPTVITIEDVTGGSVNKSVNGLK
jgi:Transglycosylase SLT domain